MAKRDPFGRLPDENPLAGLGALSDGGTSQAGEPVVVSAKDDWSGGEPGADARPAESTAKQQAAMWAASAPPASAPPSKPAAPAYPAVDQSLAEAIRRAEAMSRATVVQPARVIGRIVRLVVLLVVLGVMFGVAKPLIDAGKDVRDAVSGNKAPSAVDQTPAAGSASTSAGNQPSAPPRVPSGLSSNSMLVRRNFDRAMRRLSSSGLGHLRTLSVRPERIDAQLLTNGGSLRSVQIRSGDSKINDFGAGGTGFSHLETIPFSKIDAGAPARLARSAAGRVRKPVSQIDYLVLLSFSNEVTWAAFTKSGKHFQASAHGRITRGF
jgi:hypothetical protein